MCGRDSVANLCLHTQAPAEFLLLYWRLPDFQRLAWDIGIVPVRFLARPEISEDHRRPAEKILCGKRLLPRYTNYCFVRECLQIRHKRNWLLRSCWSHSFLYLRPADSHMGKLHQTSAELPPDSQRATGCWKCRCSISPALHLACRSCQQSATPRRFFPLGTRV